MDLITSLPETEDGFRYVLVVVDMFTGMSFSLPTKKEKVRKEDLIKEGLWTLLMEKLFGKIEDITLKLHTLCS